MATLSDPVILALFHRALSDWQYTGSILFKPDAWEWLRRELGDNHTQKGIAKILWEHAQAGGKIDVQVENRNLEVHDRLIRDYHYDLRVLIDGQPVYFETVLIDDDPTEPVIWVVSVHDP